MTKRKDGPSSGVKLRVMKRDTFRCTYCGVSGNDAELQVDHIIPMSKGGSNHISNLTTACAKCNNTKNDTIGWANNTQADQSDEDCTSRLIFIHIIKEGRIRNQGTVLEKNDGHWLVQRYSMLDGSETDVVALSEHDIFNPDKVRMYRSEEEWKLAVVKQHALDGMLKGSIEENIKCQMQRWGF